MCKLQEATASTPQKCYVYSLSLLPLSLSPSLSLSLSLILVLGLAGIPSMSAQVHMSLKQLAANFPTNDFLVSCMPALPSTFTTLLLVISSMTNSFNPSIAMGQDKHWSVSHTRPDTSLEQNALGSYSQEIIVQCSHPSGTELHHHYTQTPVG